MDPRPTKGPIKSTLSVCLSVCLSVRFPFQHFPWVISFLWFLAQLWIIEIFKNWQSPFFQENSFFAQIWTERVFWNFWKVLQFFFGENNLKRKLILLLIFNHQSHIWQNSGSRILGQNTASQSNWKNVSQSQERSE